MRVTRTDNSPTNVTLTIQADADDLAPIHKHVLSHFKNVKVPGFRAGKAPTHLVEQNIDQQALTDEFMEHAINDLYRAAIDNQKLTPLQLPQIQLKKFVPYTQLEFTAETDVLGPVKLANYKTLKLAKPKPAVSADEVNEVLKSLKDRQAERIGTDQPAKLGDELIIDFAGTDTAGKPIPNTAGEALPLVLGSGAFIPGFEDQLVGATVGQTKDFDITFPKDYGVPAMQSKKVHFSVTLKTVFNMVEPKLDDDFAKKVGPFASLKELKDDIKKQLLAEKVNQVETDYQNQLMRQIAAKSTIEVPKSLVEQENLRLEDQEKQNLAGRGQTWQEHLDAEKLTEDQHRQRHYPEAEERVKIGLLLNEIAQAEAIKVSDQEVDLRLQLLKGQYNDPQMQAELDKPDNRRDIESRLLTEKTLAKLTAYASK